MKKHQEFNFSEDRESRQVKVRRKFEAHGSTVWAAWTQKELLDQWWAPEPWRTQTQAMNFSEGGQWLYAMVGPEGESQNCRADYTDIKPKEYFSFSDAFCDKDGNIDDSFPRSRWKVRFNNSYRTTIVEVEIQHETEKDLEAIMQMGFREGFTAALGNLDRLLEQQQQESNSRTP